jgi:hypothetical protein
MAMTIFLVLNGLGVVFLLYVLANFWKEGHRPKKNARKYAAEFGSRDWVDVVVVTHPISHSAQGGLSVIPFPAPTPEIGGQSVHRPATREAIELRPRRISTR